MIKRLPTDAAYSAFALGRAVNMSGSLLPLARELFAYHNALRDIWVTSLNTRFLQAT